MFTWFGAVNAAEPDPKVMSVALPKDIKWTLGEAGNYESVLYGDPSKPGLYIVLTKWTPGKMSRPHFHPNDRYITVISGTWWAGKGPKFDPNSTTPLGPGSYMLHPAGEIHYDGAKDVEAIVEIKGIGPAPSIPAAEKR